MGNWEVYHYEFGLAALAMIHLASRLLSNLDLTPWCLVAHWLSLASRLLGTLDRGGPY